MVDSTPPFPSPSAGLPEAKWKKYLRVVLTATSAILLFPFLYWVIEEVLDVVPELFGEMTEAVMGIAGVYALISRFIAGILLSKFAKVAKIWLIGVLTLLGLAFTVFVVGLTYLIDWHPYCLQAQLPDIIEILECEIESEMVMTSSFPGDVTILTPEGAVPLKDIRIGDEVISFDLSDKRKTKSAVQNVISRGQTEFVKINETLRATQYHPFAVLGDQIWKDAGDLAVGDCLMTLALPCTDISSIYSVRTALSQPVYNIQVSGPKNYFVMLGDKPVLVHNKTIVSPEQMESARKYWALIDEMNAKYPWIKMSSRHGGGGYLIVIEGMENLEFLLWSDPEQNHRIPHDQLRATIEQKLNDIAASRGM